MIEEMSDASGTLWLDVGARDWSDAALAATGLTRDAMPRLVEGNAPAGHAACRNWPRAGAYAAGPCWRAAQGTTRRARSACRRSGPATHSSRSARPACCWRRRTGFRPYPQAAVHAFCHALPGTWHQMGVTLSAAASLAWWAGSPGVRGGAAGRDGHAARAQPALFLPYLSGERTPHNDGTIRGAFAGLSHDTDRAALTQAVLEGVAFSLRDCLDALAASGTRVEAAT